MIIRNISIKNARFETLSYVERAFYDYLKNTMTSGARMLIERRLILFSFLLALVGAANTGLAFLYVENGEFDLDDLKLFFLFQVAIAIGFVSAGLISPIIRLRSTLGRFAVLFISAGDEMKCVFSRFSKSSIGYVTRIIEE